MFRPFNMSTNYDASPNDTIEIYKNHLSYIFAISTMKIFSVVILRLGFYIFSGIWNTVFPPLEIWLEKFFYKTEEKFWNGRWFEWWIWNEINQTGQFKVWRRRTRTALSCPCPAGQTDNGQKIRTESGQKRDTDRTRTVLSADVCSRQFLCGSNFQQNFVCFIGLIFLENPKLLAFNGIKSESNQRKWRRTIKLFFNDKTQP